MKRYGVVDGDVEALVGAADVGHEGEHLALLGDVGEMCSYPSRLQSAGWRLHPITR